jgi:hypothetical protein
MRELSVCVNVTSTLYEAKAAQTPEQDWLTLIPCEAGNGSAEI